MEWLKTLLQSGSLTILIVMIAFIGAFSIAGFKAHHRHKERIEKIKNGFNPEL